MAWTNVLEIPGVQVAVYTDTMVLAPGLVTWEDGVFSLGTPFATAGAIATTHLIISGLTDDPEFFGQNYRIEVDEVTIDPAETWRQSRTLTFAMILPKAFVVYPGSDAVVYSRRENTSGPSPSQGFTAAQRRTSLSAPFPSGDFGLYISKGGLSIANGIYTAKFRILVDGWLPPELPPFWGDFQYATEKL